jgi:hypothetical protein
MSVKHVWNVTIQNATGASVITDVITITADDEHNINDVIAGNSTVQIVAPIVVADIASFYMEATAACTVDLNSSTTPASPGALSLVANRAYAWKNTDPGTNPLTVNITSIYVTNPGASSLTFKAGFLLAE